MDTNTNIKSKNILTDAQKKIIKRLGHPLYDIEYIEEWLLRKDNAEESEETGFMDAVRLMEQAYPEIPNEISLKITKYCGKLADGVECTTRHCTHSDETSCWKCPWSTDTPYVIDAKGKHAYPDGQSYVVEINGGKYVLNEAHAKELLAAIEKTLMNTGLGVSCAKARKE